VNKSLKGKFLLASGGVADDNFFETVILIIEHDDSGAFGLIVNQETDTNLADVYPFFSEMDGNLFYGGPVRQDSMFILYDNPELSGLGQEVLPGLFMGSDESLFQEVSESGADFRLMAGYAGWGPSQLDSEFTANAWLVSTASLDLVLDDPPEDLYRNLLDLKGGIFSYYADFVSDPRLN